LTLVLDVEVVDDPEAAAVLMDPIRGRLIGVMSTPMSAAGVAAQVGLSRQRVSYLLRALEAHGLVRQVDQRQWGGLTERLLVASAASYVVSPAALGGIGADPRHTADRLSARYLVALAARAIREVGGLMKRADAESKRLATFSLDAEVRFGSAADRAAFTTELAAAVSALVARYHAADTPRGRVHRLIITAYPRPAASAQAPDHSDHAIEGTRDQ
jgi:DNA-binding transcriptional ArsR family regulator